MTTSPPPDDETPDTPAPEPTLHNPKNLSTFQVLGNVLLEGRQHLVNLELLYEELRSLERSAPKLWEEKLLNECERHRGAGEENLKLLREAADS